MLRIFSILTSFLFVLSFNSFALTIDEAVQLALKTNDTLKAQQENVSARSLEKGVSILIFFPTIGASYEYSYSTPDTTSAGGSLNYLNSSTASLNANLNIFNGLGDLSKYWMANLNSDAAGYQFTSASYDVMLSAQSAYVNVLKAKHDLEVANSNLELLRLQERDAKISAENGVIARKDLLQVQVYLASAELQRITASSNLTVALQNLETVINRVIPEEESFLEPEMINFDVSNVPNLENMMYKNRSDLKQLEANYEISKKNVWNTAAPAYPSINVGANYYFYGNDPSPLSGNPLGKDKSFLLTATASWNLITAATSTVQAMAKNKDSQGVLYNMAYTKKTMLLDLRSAVEMYMKSQAQYSQSQMSVAYAEENYRVMKNLYDQGAATMTDLLNASVMLNQAKVEESASKYGVISSVYRIERLVEAPIDVILKQQN